MHYTSHTTHHAPYTTHDITTTPWCRWPVPRRHNDDAWWTPSWHTTQQRRHDHHAVLTTMTTMQRLWPVPWQRSNDDDDNDAMWQSPHDDGRHIDAWHIDAHNDDDDTSTHNGQHTTWQQWWHVDAQHNVDIQYANRRHMITPLWCRWPVPQRHNIVDTWCTMTIMGTINGCAGMGAGQPSDTRVLVFPF